MCRVAPSVSEALRAVSAACITISAFSSSRRATT